MKYLFYALIIVFLTGLNLGLFAPFTFFGALPNLVLLTILILAVIESDVYIVLFASLLGGFMWDLISSSPVGMFMVGYMIAGGLVFTLSRRVFFIQDRVKYLSVFLIVFQILLFVWSFVFAWYGYRLHWSTTIFHPAHFTIHTGRVLLYNLLLLYPLYIVVLLADNTITSILRRRQTLS